LFQPNRFSGYDRIGDTHQVSVGLTKRLINQLDGKEEWRFDLGQIYYLQDRKVALSTDSTELNLPKSDLLFTARSRLGKILADVNLLPDANKIHLKRSQYRIFYQRDEEDFASLSYRDDEKSEQVDLTLLWSFYKKWQFAGRWQYSIPDEEPVEWVAGLQYQSCCYNLRLAKRRYINNTSGDVKITLLVELELKGLVSVGTNIADILRRDSEGFR
jgi:LPS-assembly protein